MCVHVHMDVSTCVHGMHVEARDGCQTSSSVVVYHIFFSRGKASHGTWSSVIGPGWLVNELQLGGGEYIYITFSVEVKDKCFQV